MIDHKEVIHQLEKILESPSFVSSKLLRHFLQYVVEQSIEGNSNNIKAYNIAVDAFGREVDFDAQKDSIVRITAGKLRKELDAYYADKGKSDLIRITIPKGTYQPEFEAIKKTSPKVVKPNQTSGFKGFYWLGSALFLAFVGFGIFKIFSSGKVPSSKPIMLFYETENLSTEPENDI